MNRLLGGIMLKTVLSGLTGLAVSLALVGFAPAASEATAPALLAADATPTPADGTAIQLGDDIIPVPASAGSRVADRRLGTQAAGAKTVHTLWISVVNVTSTTSDNSVTVPDAAGAEALVAAVNSYWSAESGGAVSVKLGGFVSRNQSASSCVPNTVLTAEEKGAFSGRFADYKWMGTNEHLIVLSREACNGVGFGTLGGNGGEVFSAVGSGSGLGVPVLLHEFGHNLGFGHAGSAICQNVTTYDGARAMFQPLPTTADCPTNEYGDVLDIMGYSIANVSPHLSSPQAIAAGYLTNFIALDGTSASTTATLAPLGASSGTRAMQVTDPLTQAKYYIEYRTPTGLDAKSAQFTWSTQAAEPVNGYTKYEYGSTGSAGVVRVLRLLPSDGYSTTAVLATSPTTTATTTAAKKKRATNLRAGESFTSDNAGFTVTVLSISPTAGAVVSFETVPKVASKTTITLKPSSVKKGKAAKVRVVVTATGVPRPAGTLGVYVGAKKVKSYSLTAAKAGVVTLTLPKLGVGKKAITVRFAATADIAASTSPRKTLTVKK